MKNRDNVEEKLYKAKHITRLPDSHLLLLTNQNREIWLIRISPKIKTLVQQLGIELIRYQDL